MCEHLVVIQHGMCAVPEQMRNIRNGLEASFPGRLHLVISQVNVGQTTDGVAASGLRLAGLVRRETPRKGGCVSFVGHSMGGVVARYAIRALEEEDWFASQGVRAANFISTASPHLGLLDIDSFWQWGIWLAGCCLGATVRDLGLQSETMKELVDELALQGMRRFQRRALYGNVQDDVGVRPRTSLLLPVWPNPSDSEDTLGEPQTPGEPQDLRESFSAAKLEAALPLVRHAVVRHMLERLGTLSWERYAVHFRLTRFRPGQAHHKICNHHEADLDNEGVHVVAHICQTFVLDPSTSLVGIEAEHAASEAEPPLKHGISPAMSPHAQ